MNWTTFSTISIYHIPALFDKFLLSTFTQKLCDSLVALDAIQIQLPITICFVYFLDGCVIPCNLHATCQAGNCVCKSGYQGNGHICTKGNVLHTVIIRLFSSILSILINNQSSTVV